MIKNVSVVIPSYKSACLVSRAINSILDSGVPAENIFVIEDGVYDETAEVLSDIGKIKHIQLKQNKGAPYARNIGLSLVKTEYVLFLDSDDYVSRDLVSGLYATAVDNQASLVFGPWRYGGKKMGLKSIKRPTVLPAKKWVTRWLSEEFVPTCSVLWSTEFVKKVGGWNEDLKQNQDGELAVRGLIAASKIAFSNSGYSVYWQHNSPNRISRNSEENKLYTANVIYNILSDWVMTIKLDITQKKNIGAFCMKQCWSAVSCKKGKQEFSKWRERANLFQYKNKGYSLKTNIMSSLLGITLSVLLRDYLHRPFVYFFKK